VWVLSAGAGAWAFCVFGVRQYHEVLRRNGVGIMNEVKPDSVKKSSQVKQRIGIYSGTFDPVHAGHIAFALQALQAAKLDVVYFVPERVPRSKHGVTHFAHRTAMIRRAIRPYAQLQLLELEDKTFSVAGTLSRLKRRFPDTTLVYLCGSDIVRNMARWPHADQFLHAVELCIGRRANETTHDIDAALASLPKLPRNVTVLQSYASAVASSHIRAALREKRSIQGLLASVRAYANKEWLYL